jgi:hypothetical protein
VKLALEDDHRVKDPAGGVDALDDSCLLPIPRLNNNRSISPIRSSNNLCYAYHSHLEPSLIEVVDIVIEDTL